MWTGAQRSSQIAGAAAPHDRREDVKREEMPSRHVSREGPVYVFTFHEGHARANNLNTALVPIIARRIVAAS